MTVKIKKTVFYILLFTFLYNTTFAFDYENFFKGNSFTNFPALDLNKIIDKIRTFGVKGIWKREVEKEVVAKTVKVTPEKQSIPTKEEIKQSIKDYSFTTPNIVTNPTLDATCSTGSESSIGLCKQNVFQACAESLYAKTSLQPECSSFPVSDYEKYLSAKNNMIANPGIIPQPINTSVGPVTPSTYIPDYSSPTVSPSLYTPSQQSSSNPGIISGESQAQQIPWSGGEVKAEGNLNATPITDGWIKNAWGTEYCNGSDPCNSKTALGYSPQSCIVSLPYKVIDTFFGTKTYDCISQFCSNAHQKGERCRNGLGQCLAPYYKQVSGRLIEVVNIQNGNRQIFPLGDVGPAGWTGNMIDFTNCSKAKINMRGKMKFDFRPVPFNQR